MAYSKQTWDTTSYVNPTRMNHIEDGIEGADLTNHGITIPNKTGTIALTSDLVKETYADVSLTLTANQLSRVLVNATADETNVNHRLRIRANDNDIACFVLTDGRVGFLSSANKSNATTRLFIAFYN
jgi:hypothetical protein